MSRSELERLVADVKADKDLQDKVKSIHPSNERIVEWANAHGYEITLDELSAYIREKKGELTEAELDRVVGGKGLSYDWTVTNPQGVSHTYDPRQLAAIGHDMFIAHPVAAQVDQGWAGYKDTFAADKQSIQDASPEALLDATQSHGATVEQSGPATLVTLNDSLGISVNHEAGGPGLVQTTVFLRDGDQILHDSQPAPGGGHEGYWTKFVLPDNSNFMVQGGEKSFYSQPDSEWIMSGGPGEIEVSGTQGTSTFEVARSPAVTATTTTDRGTTFTSASGTNCFLPHVPTSDWTVTNSQGDYRTFTPEQVNHGEVNWLLAHPTIDAWPVEKPTALADWNADKAAAPTHAQDPAVQALETAIDSFETTGETYGEDLPHGGWLSPASSNGMELQAIDTAQGREIDLGHGEVQVYGTEPSDGSQQFVLQHEVDATVNDPSWWIQTRSGLEINLGRPYGPDTEDTVSKGGATLVHEVNDGQGQWIVRSNWVQGAVVDSGEQWTIEKGDSPVTPQSVEPDWSEVARDHFVQAHPSATTITSDITVENNWYVTNQPGQIVREYSSNELLRDAENWEAAHPQAAQRAATWSSDKELYQTEKQMWTEGLVDGQAPQQGEFFGAKGEVSYTITPFTDGATGYEVTFDGPDSQVVVQPSDTGHTVRYVPDQSGKYGFEVDFSNGSLDEVHFHDSEYIAGDGSTPAEIFLSNGGYFLTRETSTSVKGPHGRSLERNELPNADPEMTVGLRDGTVIQWQKSDETHAEDGIPLYEANLEYFDVAGRGGQEFGWSSTTGLTYYFGETVENLNPLESATNPFPSGGIYGGTFLDPGTYSATGASWSFQVPLATVEVSGEYGFYCPGDDNAFATDKVTVEFNDGSSLMHSPHETSVFYEKTSGSDSYGHLLWVDGKLDAAGEGYGRELRNPGEVTVTTASGGTMTFTPALSPEGGYTADTPYSAQLSYQGVDGNVFVFDSQAKYFGPDTDDHWADEGNPTFSLDGTQIEKGQDATIMGPYGRVSVEWGVSSQDLPDGSSQSGTDSGFVVVGVHKDAQVVQIEESGHRAWVIDNNRVINPYTYVSEVQAGEITPSGPAGVTSDVWVMTQVDVASNAVEAVDVASTVQVVGEIEVFLFAFAFVT